LTVTHKSDSVGTQNTHSTYSIRQQELISRLDSRTLRAVNVLGL